MAGSFRRARSSRDVAALMNEDRPRPVPRTRAAGVWVALVSAALVLVLVLIFLLQNGQRSEVHFLGAHGSLPMGLALLIAAVFGALVAAASATVRIVQLRRLAVRRDVVPTTPPATDTTAEPTATDTVPAGPTETETVGDGSDPR